MKKIMLLLLLYLAPLLTFLHVIPAHIDHTFTIYPSDISRVYSLTDAPDMGKSEVLSLDKQFGEIKLSYILKKGFAFPYIGLGFELYTNEIPQIDHYDRCVLSIAADRQKSFTLNLLTKVSDPEKTGARTKICVYTKLISTGTERTETTVPFSAFKIPEWWFTKFHASVQNPIPLDLNKLVAIEILAVAHDKDMARVSTMWLQSLRFERNILMYYIRSIIAAVILYIIIFALMQWFKSKKMIRSAKNVLKIHKNLDLGNASEREAAKLFDYLSKHFNAPYLSVREISKELGISAYKIPKIINRYAELSFKQYINLLRVDEAKNLLVNSDSKIIDIAFAVGYNSIAHFNKLFKEAEGISPRSYRNKYDKKNVKRPVQN